ncbi:hypothetical protein Vafri_21277, partial [Volvox africanus]
GTPCNNFTGLNLHAPRTNILDDNMNRLILTVLEVIKFLRPKYVYLEQVPSAMIKENGMWIRTVLGHLECLGYQYEVGDIASGGPHCLRWAATCRVRLVDG